MTLPEQVFVTQIRVKVTPIASFTGDYLIYSADKPGRHMVLAPKQMPSVKQIGAESFIAINCFGLTDKLVLRFVEKTTRSEHIYSKRGLFGSDIEEPEQERSE